MGDFKPLRVAWPDDDDPCEGNPEGFSEFQSGETIEAEVAPGRTPIGGTDITVVVSDTNFTINHDAGAGGDITSVVAGTGLTGGGTEDDVTLNVIGGTGITANPDNITTTDSEIVHDNLSGFVANEHIDHTSVSITAGTGLTGGGTIASTRTLSTNDGAIVHDNLSGFVANEHVDHSTVDIIAGAGCTGGGDLTSDRTINVIAGTGITVNTNDVQTNDGAIVHDNLSGFVANEHVDHSTVDIIAGAGISGGGDLTSDRSISVNVDATSVKVNSDGAVSVCGIPVIEGGVHKFYEVCATGDNSSGKDVLTYDITASKICWSSPSFTGGGGKMGFAGGGTIIANPVAIAEGDFDGTLLLEGAGEGLIARNVHVGNDLSGHPDCVTTLDSSASISGCPYPPPFSWLQSTASLGTGVDNFYFGSGVSVTETTMGTDGISFDSTNGYWEITSAGWYEVDADIGINVTVSPATIKNYVVITSTGYGGVESALSFTTQELRTNIDPHLTRARWMGYLTAGVKLAIKCDTDAGTIKSERYSVASVKRIG